MAADLAGRGGDAVDCELGGCTVEAWACRRREALGLASLRPSGTRRPPCSREVAASPSPGRASSQRLVGVGAGGRAGEGARRARDWSFLARGECPPARSSAARPRQRPGASFGREPAGLRDPGRGWRRGFQWRHLGWRGRGRVCCFGVWKERGGRNLERWIFRSHPFSSFYLALLVTRAVNCAWASHLPSRLPAPLEYFSPLFCHSLELGNNC